MEGRNGYQGPKGHGHSGHFSDITSDQLWGCLTPEGQEGIGVHQLNAYGEEARFPEYVILFHYTKECNMVGWDGTRCLLLCEATRPNVELYKAMCKMWKGKAIGRTLG